MYPSLSRAIRMMGGLAFAATATSSVHAQAISPFTEEAEARGLVMQGITFPPQTGFYGFGAGFADIDNDGDPDAILLTNDDLRVGLFENDGTGHFTDRTLTCGIPSLASPSGFGAVDYDGDGDLDIVVSRVLQPVRLYRNEGNWTFSDVSVAAGLAQVNRIGKSVTWADYNNDGWVDLYMCNYRFVPGGPGASDNQLYRNNGNGTFTEVGASVGLNSAFPTLEAVWTDFDHDGDVDVYLSNDRGMTAGDPGNQFFRNDGGVFTDIGEQLGLSVNIDSMGLACGDFNRDGKVDFYCTNTAEDIPSDDWNFPLLLSTKKGMYVNSELIWGVAHPGTTWGWGCMFFDWNNDSWLDLYVCNMFEPNDLFQNNGAPQVENVTEAAAIGGSPGYPAAKYGASFADVDGDGDLDVMMNDQSVPVTLYINHEGEKRSWLRFRIIGDSPNTRAIGAFAQVTASGVTQVQEIYGGGNSYLGLNEQMLHFGLGSAKLASAASIRWPGTNAIRTFSSIPVNHRWTIYPTAKLGDADQDGDVDAVDRASLCAAKGAVQPGTEMLDFDGNFIIGQGDILAFKAKFIASGLRWADFSGDGHVDAADLAILLGAWGSSDCLKDLNGDGTISAPDLSILLGDWG
ncbi:MAG: VCBS repeat-containing protein [Phycisphaerae bacterium]|jgi:hypothetical protein|nr:VCBS repeat-containing protein [Phycisphaerae bacterium]